MPKKDKKMTLKDLKKPKDQNDKNDLKDQNIGQKVKSNEEKSDKLPLDTGVYRHMVPTCSYTRHFCLHNSWFSTWVNIHDMQFCRHWFAPSRYCNKLENISGPDSPC